MDKQEVVNKISDLEDFVFEIRRVSGKGSEWGVELEAEELEELKTAHRLLDKISARVLNTEEQIKDYELYQKDVRAEYAATRGVRSGPIGGRR